MPDNQRLPIINAVPDGGSFSSQKPRLIVAGSPSDAVGIIKHISMNLYHVRQAKTSRELLEMLSEDDCDLVLLDAKVADIDSVSLIKMLSLNKKSFYLLVRSESDDEVDTVVALELGADDCIAISCSAREIKARVRALLRRRTNDVQGVMEAPAKRNPAADSELSCEGWVLNRDKRLLYSPAGDSTSLTSTEYGILVNLFREPGLIKDRSYLLNIDTDAGKHDGRSLDVFVSRLRKKLAKQKGPDLIETVRGRGYRLNVDIHRGG